MIRFELRLARSEDADKVEAFNKRMAQAGQRHRLSLSQPFDTISLQAHSPIVIERYFSLVEGHIRGGVCVKRIQFRVNGSKDKEIAFYSYPLSEGIIDPTFGIVGLMIHKGIMRRYPLIYGLGTGSLKEPVARLMIGTGWYSIPVPFHFAVIHPTTFLRNFTYLRQRKSFRLLLDLLAFSGLGFFGVSLFKIILSIRGRRPDAKNLVVERFDEWGPWADDIWEQARDRYTLIGDRSSAALRALYPTGHKHFIKVRIKTIGEQTIGWAVLSASRVNDHKYFGNMVVGALIDMLAVPESAYQVVSGALSALYQMDADIIVVNHSAASWNDAFGQAGLLAWNTNFFLFLSPGLCKELDPIKEHADRFYFTRGDGDGAINLW